jgi:mRNA interferase RelE/StbE
MILEFDKSFFKSLDKIKIQSVKTKTELLISAFEKADSLQNIPHIKKLAGFKNYYRVRIGNYRLGFELIGNNKVRFIVIGDRKDIYRLFP